jgi:hypothetical protein
MDYQPEKGENMGKKLFVFAFCFILVLTFTISFMQANSKSALPSKTHKPYNPQNARGTMLSEGFEGSFPPAGWDTLSVPGGTQGGTTLIPWHQDYNYYYTGSYGAAYGWGYALDGWMRILNLDFSSVATATLSWWWESSYYWHVDPYDHGDLFIEVSTDGGSNWDVLWTFGDSANVVNSGVPWPWTSWQWYQSTLSLDAYAGYPNVYVGFHLVADDNADVGVDDVLIDTTTASGVEGVEGQNPFVFALSQNIPNPFTNGQTEIAYAITQSGPVSLKIYDNTGRLVRILVNTRQHAGRKSVQWNGRDSNNNMVAAGVYFYKLTANGKSASKKMIVVR